MVWLDPCQDLDPQEVAEDVARLHGSEACSCALRAGTSFGTAVDEQPAPRGAAIDRWFHRLWAWKIPSSKSTSLTCDGPKLGNAQDPDHRPRPLICALASFNPADIDRYRRPHGAAGVRSRRNRAGALLSRRGASRSRKGGQVSAYRRNQVRARWTARHQNRPRHRTAGSLIVQAMTSASRNRATSLSENRGIAGNSTTRPSASGAIPAGTASNGWPAGGAHWERWPTSPSRRGAGEEAIAGRDQHAGQTSATDCRYRGRRAARTQGQYAIRLPRNR